MQTLADQLQNRLERHFEGLAETREESGLPVFAIEHGLSDGETDEIRTCLLEQLRFSRRLSKHWLLWVIYATEHGYGYAGDEYWQSFEENTPGWTTQHRYQLVRWFRKFQHAYSGVVPTGPWASHFRIIAWPITHAILPRYLQHQFARALYDLRFRLAGLANFESVAVGQLLAAHAHTSTRFEEFLQQEELTGRIVLAFLGQNPAGGEKPIYLPTLQRIVADLEKVRNAREWLNEAQRTVSDRFKGLGRGTAPPLGHAGTGARHFGEIRTVQPNIRPSLLLRYSGSATWSVVLDIRDFRSVIVNAEIRKFLKTVRCRLNGEENPKPGGWLVSGRKKAKLETWPDPNKPLIQFERTHATVDHILQSECRPSAGPVWLFRIGQDGIAREVIGRIVRPAYEYIVVTKDDRPESCSWVDDCEIDCDGVEAFRLAVPASVSSRDAVWLARIGLQVARTIRVWPAGFPARAWDGEGSCEWLTTETPCFGIVHHHPVDAYLLRLNDSAETTIEPGPAGCTTFIRLPQLQAGSHTLSVRTRGNSNASTGSFSHPAEGYLTLNVRAPEPWNPGSPSHTGFIVTTDPYAADLNMLWENRVRVSVLGPESHHVTCIVKLATSDGEEILCEQVGGPMKLPVLPEVWSRIFSQFIQAEDYAWRYLEASTGYLIFKAEELGEYVVSFEHDVLPIRWVVRRKRKVLSARLVDDTGQENGQPTSLFFGMQRPMSAEKLVAEPGVSGFVIEPPGGLFVAQQGDYRDAVVASAGLSDTGLQGLGVKPYFQEIGASSVSLEQGCQFLELWCTARLAGPLADIRRNSVTRGLRQKICNAICGATWASLEAQFSNAPTQRKLDNLKQAVDQHSEFGVVLTREFGLTAADPVSYVSWFAELAGRYRVCSKQTVCELALWLASQSLGLSARRQNEMIHEPVNEIRCNPAILRGARLLELLHRTNEDKLGPNH